jgi:hypothetical protein
MWWTKTKEGADTCYAIWTPNLPADGYYELFAYIPYSNATAAEYKINSADGVQTYVLNQKSLTDAWGVWGLIPSRREAAGRCAWGTEAPSSGKR